MTAKKQPQIVALFGNPTATDTLRQLANQRFNTGDKPFLKMQKDGKWCYGAEEIDVKPTDQWAVNPDSIQLGFIAWDDGQVVGEQMARITEPTGIQKENLPAVSGNWDSQVGFDLKLAGTDIEVTYKSSSNGGKEMFGELCQSLYRQSQDNPEAPLPVVKLVSSNYKHKQYGKIYKPLLEYLDWLGADGAPVAERKKLV